MSCGPAHRKWCSSWHEQLVLDYRDARDAREALRESGPYMQHEPDDFAAEHPPILFRDFLVDYAARNRCPW